MALGPTKTANELRQLMLVNNSRQGKRFHYFDFTYVPKQGWFCWFEIDTRDVEGRLNGNKSKP